MIEDKHFFCGGDGQRDRRRLDILNDILNPASQIFINNSGIETGMKVLDIACGFGRMSCWLAETIGPTGSVTALDLNPLQINAAKKLAKEKGITNIEFKVMSVYDLAELGENFDLAYHRFLLIHATNPTAAIKAMHACLKPKGTLLSEVGILSHCYSDPVCESYDSFIKLAKQLFLAQGKNYDSGKSIFSSLKYTGFIDITCHLSQLFLTEPAQKIMMILGLENMESALLKNSIADTDSIYQLLSQLKKDHNDPGLWALPSLCQAKAIKP